MQIRVKSYTFQLSEPFQPGQAISLGEAQALNGLRAERLREQASKAISTAEAGSPDGLLSPAQLIQVTERVQQLDAEHEFLPRKGPLGSTRPGAIEAEARAIAAEAIASALSAWEQTRTPAEIEQFTRLYMERPDVQELARKRVAERQRVAAAGIEGLL